MGLFLCPYLGQAVELSEERRSHITERHPETLPEYENQLAEVLAAPDSIHRSQYDESARIFSKWFDSIKTGRYLIAVVVTTNTEINKRHWIITAYTSSINILPDFFAFVTL